MRKTCWSHWISPAIATISKSKWPLRTRKQDIPLLADHFIKMYASRTHRKTEGISPDALARLTEYTWPGNVRELQNVIERSVLMSSEPILSDISFMSASAPLKEPTVEDSPRVKTIAEMERDHILTVLRKCKGRISGSGGAAELLRLPASTLKSKMKKLGIGKIYKE